MTDFNLRKTVVALPAKRCGGHAALDTSQRIEGIEIVDALGPTHRVLGHLGRLRQRSAAPVVVESAERALTGTAEDLACGIGRETSEGMACREQHGSGCESMTPEVADLEDA
ncbi:unannotated protein [freshwater metagenome]|uniref:Unannotated protein n=1 Tax=freshwater metagenome TaxID=449393 RepID=A0A6J7SKQ3_9ZZZZ